MSNNNYFPDGNAESNDGDAGARDYDDNIPTLTQQIPVIDQRIPELTETIELTDQQIPELTETVELPHQEIPELNNLYHEPAIQYAVTYEQIGDHELETHQGQLEQQSNEQADDWQAMAAVTSSSTPSGLIAKQPTEELPVINSDLEIQHPVTIDQVGDHELEIQQWQIEQQAQEQRGDWQALADVKSPELESELQIAPEGSNNEEIIELSSDQQAVLDASWQALETFIMEQLPPEIAGTYLTVIEQNILSAKARISSDIRLLDDRTLESLLDYYHQDQGL